MRTIFALLLVALPGLASAFVLIETDISQPYEIFPVEHTLPDQAAYLGTLDDFPVMYEVRSEEPFTFTARLQQPANRPIEPLALLLIRRNDRGGGVTEIVRQNIAPTDWVRTRDSLLGITMYLTDTLTVDVEPGIYRLEVSSPTNIAQYYLTIGEQPQASGYFEQLGYVRQVQTYFGYSFFTILRSSLVYYPIGILLLLGALYQTWRFASKRRTDA